MDNKMYSKQQKSLKKILYVPNGLYIVHVKYQVMKVWNMVCIQIQKAELSKFWEMVSICISLSKKHTRLYVLIHLTQRLILFMIDCTRKSYSCFHGISNNNLRLRGLLLQSETLKKHPLKNGHQIESSILRSNKFRLFFEKSISV